MSSSQANIAELLVRVKEAYGAERFGKDLKCLRAGNISLCQIEC